MPLKFIFIFQGAEKKTIEKQIERYKKAIIEFKRTPLALPPVPLLTFFNEKQKAIHHVKVNVTAS